MSILSQFGLKGTQGQVPVLMNVIEEISFHGYKLIFGEDKVPIPISQILY